MKNIFIIVILCCAAYGYNAGESGEFAGPYSSAMQNKNGAVPDAAVAGFVGPSGLGVCSPGAADEQPGGGTVLNYVNPVFSGWASGYYDYIPAPAVDTAYIGNEQYSPARGVPAIWRKPLEALGAVTGDNFNVCVLGDLWQSQLDMIDTPANQLLAYNDPYKIQPGSIVLTFTEPIRNHPGPDFAVFENGFISAGGAGVNGQIFAELAFVEVSSNGTDFVRFPSVSLTNGNVGAYGTVDPSNVYNLAGKHVNAYEASWGTPFNLKDIENHPQVANGSLDLNNITFVRIVDIPGNGYFRDEAVSLVDPNSLGSPEGAKHYAENHGIYDAWVTWGSGGFDLEAVGVIRGNILGDANLDGLVDMADFAALALYWRKTGFWSSGDFSEDNYVDEADLMILADNWLN